MRSSSGCGTDDCGRTSATSRPSTMPSPPSTRPSDARGRRSSAFVREDSGCTAHTSCQSRRGRLASARKERTGCSAWLPMAMRFASCQSARLRLPVSSHGLSKASLGAGIGDRDGLGIDHSGRDTEDRATRLEVRMAVRTVAAVPPPLWKLYSQRIGKLRPALR